MTIYKLMVYGLPVYMYINKWRCLMHVTALAHVKDENNPSILHNDMNTFCRLQLQILNTKNEIY